MSGFLNCIVAAVFCVTAFVALFSESALAAVPAGTEIVNQAVIRYTDADGIQRDTTTNIVVLTVQQAYAATLAGDQSITAAPGKDATFFHLLKNNGNGTDQYCVQIRNDTADTGDFTQLKVVNDANNNGQFDAGDPLLSAAGATDGTVTLAAGQEVHLLVIGAIPSQASAGYTYKGVLTVRAQNGSGSCQSGSVIDTGTNADALNDTNVDTATVTNNAILKVTKSSQYNNNGPGPNDDTITYTVTIQNTGLSAAKDVLISDPLPANTSFVGGSLTTAGDYFSTVGIDDGFNGKDGSLPQYNVPTPGAIAGEVDLMLPAAQVSFTYTVLVASNLPGGTQINNTATVHGVVDNNPLTVQQIITSNMTVDAVPLIRGVTISDTGTGKSPAVNDGGDDDALSNDIQYVDQAGQGETVFFTHIVTNSGNAVDTFNLSIAAGTFPAGTVFNFYRVGGVLPLLDTDKNGLPDTGPLASGGSLTILVKAMLPAKANGGGAYTATVTAASSADPSKTDTTQEVLGTIIAEVVDLANSSSAVGFNDKGAVNADPVSAVTTTLNVAAGKSVVFNLYIANESLVPDSYQLTAWADLAATLALPSGWQAIFTDMAGNVISATPLLKAADVFYCTVTIYAPGSAAVATVQLFFKAASSVSGIFDIKQDAVKVIEREQITLTADQLGTVQPGNSVSYTHTLTNSGSGHKDVVVLVRSQTLFSSVIMLPTHYTGTEADAFTSSAEFRAGTMVAVYSAAAKQWTMVAVVSAGASGVAIPLDPGDFTTLMVRVFSPPSAPQYASDTLVLGADALTGASHASNTDQTLVNSSQLNIVKMGAIDANCDGVPDSTFASATQSARPGECVIWQITATNMASSGICEVAIRDSVSSFTVFRGVPVIYSEPPPGGVGSCGISGQEFMCKVGNPIDINHDGIAENFCLKGGDKAEIRFSIRVK